MKAQKWFGWILGLAMASGAWAQNISIATGGTGGVYYPYGGGLASEPKKAARCGAGWPTGMLTELIAPEPGIGELRLLMPLLLRLPPPKPLLRPCPTKAIPPG